MKLMVYRCDRCSAMFCVKDGNEKYGPHYKYQLLEANPCEACGKGQVELIGCIDAAPVIR
jgi:hypothetical protein